MGYTFGGSGLPEQGVGDQEQRGQSYSYGRGTGSTKKGIGGKGRMKNDVFPPFELG